MVAGCERLLCFLYFVLMARAGVNTAWVMSCCACCAVFIAFGQKPLHFPSGLLCLSVTNPRLIDVLALLDRFVITVWDLMTDSE